MFKQVLKKYLAREYHYRSINLLPNPFSKEREIYFELQKPLPKSLEEYENNLVLYFEKHPYPEYKKGMIYVEGIFDRVLRVIYLTDQITEEDVIDYINSIKL